MSITADAPPQHRVAPFEGLIRRLSRKAADAERPGLVAAMTHATEANVIDGWVAGALGLSRGAVFVQDKDVTEPFLFAGTVQGRPAHVVVAREYGDVSWPAFLAREKRTAAGDASRIVQEGLADVIVWLSVGAELRDAYERSLLPPCPACGDKHEFEETSVGGFDAILCDNLPAEAAYITSKNTTVRIGGDPL